MIRCGPSSQRCLKGHLTIGDDGRFLAGKGLAAAHGAMHGAIADELRRWTGRRPRSRRRLLLCGCADGHRPQRQGVRLMGISPAAQAAQETEPKLAERAPLVLPPDSAKLPQPGSGAGAGRRRCRWPDDPEQRKAPRVQGARTAAFGLLPRRRSVERKGAGQGYGRYAAQPLRAVPHDFGRREHHRRKHQQGRDRIGRRCGVLRRARGSRGQASDRAAWRRPSWPRSGCAAAFAVIAPTLICCHLTSACPEDQQQRPACSVSRPTRKRESARKARRRQAAASLVVRICNLCRNQAIAASFSSSHSPSQCSRKPSKRCKRALSSAA